MTASPPEVTLQALGLEDPADEYARLALEVELALAPHQGKIKRLEDLREHFLGILPASMRGNQEGFIDGTESRILVSMCDHRTEVTLDGKRKLKRLWGAEAFLERAKIDTGQLPDPKDKKRLYTVKARTGPRHLKAIPKPQDAVAKAA
jgi:hypothetical protein